MGIGMGSMLIPTYSTEKFTHRVNQASQKDPFWNIVRDQFPVTKVKTYFNTGTMGPSPYQVIDIVNQYNRWMETYGEYQGVEVAREKLAEYLNVQVSELSLTHNTTEGINIIAWGLPLKRGDEVIMTTHEHVGNALPWLNRAKIDGIVIKTFEPGKTAAENLNRINDLINTRTRVIAIPHITTTTGTRFPAKEVAQLGHEKGLWVFMDGAHGPGSMNIDLNTMDVDFYAASTHKWVCGPNGTGFLYVKQALLDTVQVYHIGAYSDTGWEISLDKQELTGYVPTAHRYDYATQNAALYKGVAEAISFQQQIGEDKVQERILELSGRLQRSLLEHGDRLEMLTPEETESRAGMVTFRLRDLNYRDFGKIASREKFRIRMVPESGLDAIRISTHIFNSEDEIDRFAELVGRARL